MSNEHVISEDMIQNKNTIYIYYDNEFKLVNIKLDEKERYIKSFKDNSLDVTVVEILDKDNISKDFFLAPESSDKNKDLVNSQIYILQYPKGGQIKFARGTIEEINNYEFTHLVSTDQGSSGSPILFEKTFRVIGIHKSCNKDKTENYADLINPVLKIIKNDIIKKRNNGKYENGKYIWDDGKYYLGQFKNNLPHGKGIKYYLNGNILYEGDFINGKFEGYGKYFYDNGDYFIGQYKNGLRNGKGKGYYADGKIKYEVDCINGQAEGNGKFFYEDGEYYIGQFKKNDPNGKGIEYYAYGNILYEGDFVDGRYEGNGKFIWEDGSYYIGQWKNGLFHGKGKEYYANGSIRYEGDYINHDFEGNGKYIDENGKYYIGQWKKGFPYGKGKFFYSNGNIQYEGDFVKGEPEGNGKSIWEDGHFS